MEYLLFNEIEDFLFNRSFIKWVAYKDADASLFWEEWVKHNPHKTELVNDAKAIIYALQLNFRTISEEEINVEIKQVLARLKEQSNLHDNTSFDHTFNQPIRLRWYKHAKLLIACSLLFGLLITVFFFITNSTTSPVENNYLSFDAAVEKNDSVYSNHSQSAQLITLPDSSTVYLEKNSSIRYNADFSGRNREVYLTGEAFFDIKRNTSKPFFVFTNTITTKVLGTSFRVKSFGSAIDAVVTVKTGKVSVFKTKNFLDANKSEKGLNSIVLVPNQEIRFTPGSSSFIKTLAEEPYIIQKLPETDFLFDATAMKDVFRRLEEAYGIPVIYDEDILSSCSLSANLGNEGFFKKMDVICKAINASYEEIDGTIVVTSMGCK